jgi:chaperonin GroES
MNATPLFDRLFVQQIEESKTTESGLILAKPVEHIATGIVLSVGPGKYIGDNDYEPMNVSVGDKIVYNKASGKEVKIEGDTVILLNAIDIIAVLK